MTTHKGLGSCQGLFLKVTIPATSTMNTIKTIECDVDSACKGAVFEIINAGSSSISVEQLDCDAESACEGASFELNGEITIAECKCGDEDGCAGVQGIDLSTCSGLYTCGSFL